VKRKKMRATFPKATYEKLDEKGIKRGSRRFEKIRKGLASTGISSASVPMKLEKSTGLGEKEDASRPGLRKYEKL
jgi:hypothetical protein